ncbi:MAG TPA: MarR family transcriptional regulator [Nocardioides sp.]|jgi:DNA-binding MarR family transcriptional regulator|nr:MarR family transcriptional regulator [Nocardioides sp.]
MSSDDPTERLGFLLKHVQAGFARRHARHLAPLGVTGRETAVLLAIGRASVSQVDLARRLGLDRTTMVALVDSLEAHGLAERGTHATDRRRHAVVLTAAGRSTLARAKKASDAAEKEFLSALSAPDAEVFRRCLTALAVL